MSVGRKWLGMKLKRRQGKTKSKGRPFRSARIEALEPRQVLSVPALTPIGDVTLYSGSPLLIPLDGFDTDGLDVNFTAASSNSSLVSTSFTSDTNRSIKIGTNYGEMVLELFEDYTPRATERIITLAESGFYDGLIFHRVIDDFMIQGGNGGSDLPDFDDQFHVDLQHNRSGLLSMAKSLEDTNSSQFFITEVPTRYLDFNHSIFGLLIEGDDVREAISEVDTKLNDNDPDNNEDADAAKPFTDVVMESVEIYYDNQNATLMLKAPEGMSGGADITVTIIDHDGTPHVQPSFHVTVVADPQNTQPFLQDIPAVFTSVDTEVSFQLTAVDIDGEPTVIGNGGVPFTVPTKFLDQFGVYDLYQKGVLGQYGYQEVRVVANPDLTYTVHPDSGAVTVTPSNGIVGVHPVLVATAAWESEQIKYLGMDTQLVPVVIQPESLTAVSELEMSIVQTSTATDEYGEIDQLPENVDWMDEWESFSVEIWASTQNHDEYGIHTAAFDLTYNTDYYTATKIEYGNVFSQDRTGTINDAAGLVENIGGRTPMFAVSSPLPGNYFSFDPENIEKFGDDKPVLVARVHFQPNATGGGVPVDNENGYMMPVTDLGFSIQNAQVAWNVAETSTVNVVIPSVNVWPVMYDCDENGRVGLGDLALFAAQYRNSVDPNDPNDPGRIMDYDRSGKIGLGDLSFFAANYRKSVLNGDVPTYPSESRDVWLPTAPATSQTMAATATPPEETQSDGDFFSTVDDGTNSELQLAYAIAQSQQDSQSSGSSTDTQTAIVDLLMRSEEL